VSVLQTIGDGLSNAFLMAWQVWWALVLGFAISGVVQAWVPRARIERALGGSGARPVGLATGLGAASSSCSYAAIAIAKSLFTKGASAASALAFQFASTNLVIELGIVIWILIGWQFTLAEFVGGLLLIVVMTLLLRLFVSRRLEREAREHAAAAETGHQHVSAGEQLSLRERLTSVSAWSDVAHNFRADWSMVWKEVAIGFLLAGFIGLLGNDFFNALFIEHAPGPLRLAENVIVGMIIAALAVDALFSGLGLIPHVRPARSDIFSSVKLDYKFVLNVLATALFAALFALTMRRGTTDPVCGMRVDRHKAL